MERALASEQSTASCSRVTPSSQPYPRLRKGSVPRPRAGAVARRVHTGPCVVVVPLRRTDASLKEYGWCIGPSRVPPCHVTNTGEEMLDHELYPDPDIIEKSQYQIPNPELGPLERQIELRYEEALFEDDPSYNPEHTSYWFTEPPGMPILQPC